MKMSEFLCLTVISDEMSSTLSVEWTEQTTRGTIVPFLQCHKTSSHLISPHQLCRANMQPYNQIYNLSPAAIISGYDGQMALI